MALSERRIALLFTVFCGLIVIAGIRAGYLGAFQSPALQKAADQQQVAKTTIPAPRGTILDRRGVELAVSQPAADISANPMLIKQPLDVARKIAPLLGESEADVLREISAKDTGFVYLKRRVPADNALKISKMGIEGIDSTPASKRTYPRRALASQVLGAVGTEGNGLMGLEELYEKDLRGVDGKRKLTSDALGEPIDVEDAVSTQPGKDISLTIDGAIQARAEKVIAEVGAKFQPKGATAVVMDPRSSEILAMANWPAVEADKLGDAPPYQRQNRAVGMTYEPGSTFKAFTVSGALNDGVVTPDTAFGLAPTIQVADRTIEESHPRGFESLTTSQIIAQSSNVGSVVIGLKLGDKRFSQWVDKFGFGHTTGVDLPGEEVGIVPALKDYSGSTMGNMPIGQGIAVTPMQMAAGYSAIANGGVLKQPEIVHEINGKPQPAAKGHRVVTRRTAAEMRSMLADVVTDAAGTGAEAQVQGYSVAGKTGTAEKADPNGGYAADKYVASFVGFAPAKNPKLLVAVMVDEPNPAVGYYGGEVAAPAFEKIMEFALPYQRIAPR